MISLVATASYAKGVKAADIAGVEVKRGTVFVKRLHSHAEARCNNGCH